MNTKSNFFKRMGRLRLKAWSEAAAAVLLVVLMSSSLRAVVVSTQYDNFNSGPADFGGSTHSFGGPSGNAVITFDYDTSTAQVIATGRVRGTLYWDDLFRGGCTRLTIRFRNQNDSNLAVRTIDECGPGGDANSTANKTQVDESFSSANLTYIRLTVGELRTDGTLAGAVSDNLLAPLNITYRTTLDGGTAQFGVDPFLGLIGGNESKISFARQNGIMDGTVTGPLFGDPRLCGRLIIDFRNISTVIDSRTRETCGRRDIGDTLDSGSLAQIKLRVGDLPGGVFSHVASQTFEFSGQTGNFELRPGEASVPANTPQNYAFTWTVPEPLNWHDLRTVDLRILDELETILWVRFDETSNTLSVYNVNTGQFGPAFAPGSPNRLQTSKATFHLDEASVAPVNSVLGTGANSPSVTLNMPLSFKPSAAGRTYRVLVAASDDLGNEDPFVYAGSLTVTP
jgi:hypothetical protein